MTATLEATAPNRSSESHARCCAVTHFADGTTQRCLQQSATTHDPAFPGCFYHNKMANQEIDPTDDEEIVAVTMRGRVIWMLEDEPDTHHEEEVTE